MSKVAKGKGKTYSKNVKTGKFATEQTMNRQTAFKLRFEAIVNVFYQSWYLHKEKETSFFIIMYGKVWFDGDFFVRKLYCKGTLDDYR